MRRRGGTFRFRFRCRGCCALGAADGKGYRSARLALYADSSTPSNRVDAGSGEAWSRLYGEQKIAPPPGADAAAAVSLGHSVARIRLF